MSNPKITNTNYITEQTSLPLEIQEETYVSEKRNYAPTFMHFENVIPYAWFIRIIGILCVLFLASIFASRRQRLFKILTAISFVLLLMLPVYLFVNKPIYTYMQAENRIEKAEDIIIEDAHYKTMLDDGKKRYFFKAQKGGIIKYFLFNPYTGEYYPIMYKEG